MNVKFIRRTYVVIYRTFSVAKIRDIFRKQFFNRKKVSLSDAYRFHG